MGYPPQGMQQMGMPVAKYNLSQTAIDCQVRELFRIHDRDRSGTFDLNETQMAINQFLHGQKQPPMDINYFMQIYQMFDIDRTGRLDFYEFKMMLEFIKVESACAVDVEHL